ncbi:MAG: thrombospondin type 3 repeat-containing protein, partial [Asgard group archaeon]|nr:thrombospondin type 3 repeat-containing protein [Asgard group archaeon]
WRGYYASGGKAITHDLENNGYFLCVEETELFSDNTILIKKMDNRGKIVQSYRWDIYYGLDTPNDIAFDISAENVIVAASSVNRTQNVYSKVIIGCFTKNLSNQLWNKTFEEVGYNFKQASITIIYDKIFVLGMKLDASNNEKSNLFLASLETNSGELDFFTLLKTPHKDSIPILKSNNQNLYLTFTRKILTGERIGSLDFIVQKREANGTLVWEFWNKCDLNLTINALTLNHYNYSSSIFVAGEFTASEKKDSIIYEISSNGAMIQNWIYGTKEKNDIIKSLLIDEKEQLILAGSTNHFVKKAEVAFLAKYTKYGEEITSIISLKYFKSYINGIEFCENGGLYITGLCKYQSDFIFDRLFISYTTDFDEDSLSDQWEDLEGLDPTNPDTDNDGWTDGEEYFYSTDPLNPKNNPNTRNSWKIFGLILSFCVVFFFIGIHFLSKYGIVERPKIVQKKLLALLSKKRGKNE